MQYKISAGMTEPELMVWLKEAYKKYGLYQVKAINYTYADIAPVVMCTIVCKNEMLIAKRGYGLADAEGYWSTINGFIDEVKPVKEFAIQEVGEELSVIIKSDQVIVRKSYTVINPKEKRKYVVFPCLVQLKSKPKIKLNEEHTEYKWITREQLESFEILEDLPVAVDRALHQNTTG